jgi:5-methylcytosine-specific restriction endonuclease McrA
MPTNRHGKVRHLLKNNLAKVVRKEPFTIKLLYDSTDFIQPLILGLDTGSGTLATAVSNTDGNIVYLSEVEVRNDITNKITQRRKYRRNRHNRKTRYRKARFNNRKNSKKTDRFSPTMISKFHSHIKEIGFVKSILPIKKLVFETGTFDTHLMKNPTMNRHWGYQQGPNYGFENTKAMVLNRDNYTCQHCKGKHKDFKLEVHHIIFKSQGGSDEHDNLITLCHTCHDNLHKGKIKLKLRGKLKGTLKYATQMNSIRIQLFKQYPEAIETFGFITKANRQLLNLLKEHYIDAAVIASNGQPITFKTEVVFKKKSVSKGDYQRTKGVRSEMSIPKAKVDGFKKFDKVKYKNNIYFIKGRYSTGYAILMDISGNKQTFTNPKIPKICNITRISARKTTLIYSQKLSAL